MLFLKFNLNNILLALFTGRWGSGPVVDQPVASGESLTDMCRSGKFSAVVPTDASDANGTARKKNVYGTIPAARRIVVELFGGDVKRI
jgi:hypothetical protein